MESGSPEPAPLRRSQLIERMKTDSPAVEVTEFFPTDELERLELKIARRADDLSEHGAADPRHAIDHWCRAEREALEEVLR